MTKHSVARKSAQEIICESLEVAYSKTPVTFIDKLFHREPPESKMKSLAITHLTDRIVTANYEKEVAEKARWETFQGALRFIEQFDPKSAREFYNQFEPK